MQKKMNLSKSGGMDKYDAHMPNKPYFVHDNYHVSCRAATRFHCTTTYGMDANYDFHKMGVNHKAHHASTYGFYVDSYNIGKSDVL